MNYLDGLNERQKEAVLLTEGPVSVLAGAGSGKTRVLTTRIYHLIRQGVAPERILAVTFTNKAAREMRERLSASLGQEVAVWRKGSVPFIATFHGLGRELLETYGRMLGTPRHFSIFDRDDSERAVKAALKSLDMDPKEVPPRAILSRISKAKGEGQTLAEFRERHGHESFRSRITADAWDVYEKTLRDEKALDFDDLIHLPVKLLEEHEEVRRLVEDRFHFIHIDEYQDTNDLQGRLTNLLAGARKNVFVVGDIDQTIYTWRGATIDNLLEFDRVYPEAKTIVLEHNYRSSKNIVDAANQIIEKNKNRKEKRSVTENAQGETIHVHMAQTGDREAQFIAQESQRLIRNGMPPEDIAVLYRTNFQSRALEEAFLTAGVAYRLLGTQFYDRKEVKDVIAWIRLALDPSREADRMRAVQFPSRGIGKVTLGKLAAGKREDLKAGERAKVEAFEKIMCDLHTAAPSVHPSEFVRLVIEHSGMKATYEKGGEDDAERLQNAQELATLASRHDALVGEEGIAAFLADVALASDQDEMDRKKERKGVTLMTVHAAKGLEFGTVFVAGLEEGLFPHEGMGDGEERDEEEERRLFYVAVTRAKSRLYLTLARVRRIYGTDFLQEPSQFISDIDASLITYQHHEEEDSIEA
ncbi:UvrD-helicase domain-containing protein [Candidatus Parcubacteria bacterium]|nr:UvrD-helicase domain-containing protein [Candidatus Parcubacteria bacterium]